MTLAERLQYQITYARALMIGLFIGAVYYTIGFDSGSTIKVAIAKAKEEIADSETQIKGLEKKLDQITTMKKVMKELGSEFETFISYIPEKLSLPELMKTISTEARSAGVSVNGMSEVRDSNSTTKVDKSVQFYEELTVAVELQGTYSQLLLFLSYLTKLDKIITVSELSMVSQAKLGDRESPVLLFKCHIKGYRYLRNSAGGSASKS